MTTMVRIAFFCVSLALVACSGTQSDEIGFDAGRVDASRDASARDLGRVDMNAMCPSAQHLCGSICVEDRANTPDVGCKWSCDGTPCLAPSHAEATCSESGVCEFACTTPWTREGDHCVCAPTTCELLGASCGMPDNGCGAPLNCGGCASGATCTAGTCECSEDRAEPNEASGSAHAIGAFNDSPGVTMDLAFNISSSSDTDWFVASIDDAGFDGNPIIEVTLADIPSGANYNLAAYFVCGDGDDASSCSAGSSDDTIGHGCASAVGGSLGEAVTIETECEHTSTEEDGTLYVHVSSAMWASHCGDYALHINVR